jgi:tetratricopeptide (TPR) repeat protein
MVVAVVLMVGYANWRDAGRRPPPPVREIGGPGAPPTSRGGLDATIATLEQRLKDDPADLEAAVGLADALMRQARVTNDASRVIRAETLLKKSLGFDPGNYRALRMLGTVYLAQHRFRDAIEAAQKARTMQPSDPWNYGVLGDANLEVGEYDAAFDSFDTMSRLRPSASVYARVAYARELRGDLAGALKNMEMATDATSASDLESLAWHYAQMGNLYFQMGRIAEAKRQYDRAAFTFPEHPYALIGQARVKAAEGDVAGAEAIYRALLEHAATPEIAASLGDLAGLRGDAAAASRYYETAEHLERTGWKTEEPQPAALSRLLSERGLKLSEAVTLAEEAAKGRSDIFTQDALAWAYFKTGRIADARAASDRALRTGTRDRRILYHAAAIRRAEGDASKARELIQLALDGHPHFDPLIAPAAAELRDDLEGERREARR